MFIFQYIQWQFGQQSLLLLFQKRKFIQYKAIIIILVAAEVNLNNQMLKQDHYKHLKVKSQFLLYTMAITVSLGAFVCGYSMTCISQLQHLLKVNNKLSDYETNIQMTLITSAFTVGALLGALTYKMFVDFFGDRRTLILCDIIVSIAIVTQLIKLNYLWIIFPRLFIGFGIGISTGVLPLYLNSLAPLERIGRFGSINQILITSGTFMSFVLGIFVSEDFSKNQYFWRLIMVFPIFFALARIFALLFIFPFDNMQTHVDKNEDNKIRQYCELIYQNARIEDIKLLKKPIKQAQLKSSFGKKRLIIAIVIIASNQLSGINGIFYYIKQLLNQLNGGNQRESQHIMIAIGFVQVVSCSFASKNMDSVGRKTIFKYGQAIIIGILFVSSLVCSMRSLQLYPQILFQITMLTLIFCHVIVMNFTLGPICIIYSSQLVTDTTFVVFTLKFLSMSSALLSDFFIKYLGIGVMFFCFATLSFIAFLYLNDKLIETNGLTKEEIFMKYDDMLSEQLAKKTVSKVRIPDTDPDQQRQQYQSQQMQTFKNQSNIKMTKS